MDLQEQLVAALKGRYEVERELGHGGMAVVYLARDVRHGRPVAIKVLPPELATSLGAERFLREISIASRLTHPNILALHESVAADDGRLLCYVMPYVEGETLAQRLRRERQLPIDEAVSIARQVAAALDFAHAHGIIHRDVKPENVMLVGDQVLLADFGLARAIHSASSASLTGSGIAVGTPAYMSPEQAAADHDVDGRTDIYSLGCVLYEMVIGEPPFRGATAQAVIAQHVTREPPSLCAGRTSCPEGLDASVRKAMAKVPADRFRSAADFSRALAAAISMPTPEQMAAYVPRASGAASLGSAQGLVASRPWWRRWMVGGAAVLVTAALVAGMAARRPAAAVADEAAAAPRYAVMPFGAVGIAGSSTSGSDAAERLADALAEWKGVALVDRRRTIELAQAGSPGAAMSTADALTAARTLAATRIVLGELRRAGAAITLRATLYDAANGAALRARAVTYRADEDGPRPFRELASALLREGAEVPSAANYDGRQPLLAAWQAYDSGRTALARWDLVTAEQELRRAVALDGEHAPAQLWLAQTQAWSQPERVDAWRDAASRAVNGIDRLSAADTLLARGVQALALERYPDACAAFGAMHVAAPKDPVPWLGLGQCRMMDDAVLRDARSPSGWRFRSSYHAAALAYDSAIHRATGTPAFAFRALAQMRLTQPAQVRSGRGKAPDALDFAAYPTLAHDTLAMIPYTSADIGRGALRADRSTRGAALRRDADMLAVALGEWVRRDSTSAEARAMLARVQETRGERANGGAGLVALATLRDALRLSSDTVQRIRLTINIVRLLVKQEQFVAARLVADSLLGATANPPVDVVDGLASVAALTGNAERASQLLAAGAVAPPVDPRVPDALATLGATYLAFAALGACGDTLARMETTVDRALQQYVAVDSRDSVRRLILARPLSLAISCLGAAPIARLGKQDDRLALIQREYAAEHSVAVRAQIDTLAKLREGIRPGDVTLDRTYQEAWLLQAIGDTTAAVRRLDLTLTAPTTLGTSLVGELTQAAALGRAMALRAELAAASGDTTSARHWAQNVVDLWDGASPVLQPTVARMRSLAAAIRPTATK